MNRITGRFQLKIRMAAVMVLLLITGMTLSGMARISAAEGFALGDIPLDKETYEKYIKKLPLERLEAVLPSSYDARNAGIVTPAKNQGSCGSCWAFASVGAFESHLLKKYNIGPYDLSEQQLVRCDTSQYGCSGGFSYASRYWESHGPITESCYPYTATDGSCSYSCTEMAYRVTGWHTVTQYEWDFKDSCYNEGPSYWSFQVYSDFADQYGHGFWYDAGSGDVYVHTGGTHRGGHAVLLIGWDDAKGAYLCKNSWGATGGPNGDGTFWIAYSGHTNNLGFGMSNFDITGGSADTPTVTTTAVSSITQTTATGGGNVTSEGGSTVTARGVCWRTSANPTTSNSKTTDGTGTGSFASAIIGLTANTTYYVRAYATNSQGTAYGNEVSFKTSATTPTVTTTAVSSITQTTATGGGNVTSEGGSTVTARGVCWSTSANPTTSNSKTTDGTGAGTFSSSITGLSPGATYHVRAYATNSAGTAYGSDVSFTTSYASTRYVCSDGYCGGRTPCNKTIQAAIDAAATGTAILIADGIYDESITLNAAKSLTLQGGWDASFNNPNGGTTTLQSAPKAPQGSLTFQNLKIMP